MSDRVGAELVALLSRRGGGRRGCGAADALIGWAGRALEVGVDSPTLRVLAGWSGPRYSSEVDEALASMLDELGLPEPESRDELLDAGMWALCREVESGSISGTEGLERSWVFVVDSCYAERFMPWLALAEDVELIMAGERPVFSGGLEPAMIEERAHELALETPRSLRMPDWLPPYLALG